MSGIQYSSRGITGFFSRIRNLFVLVYYTILSDILRFHRIGKRDIGQGSLNECTLGEYLHKNRFSAKFIDHYIIPMGSAIWSPTNAMLEFPAGSFLRFLNNHGLLSLTETPQWKIVAGGSHVYVKKIIDAISGTVFINNPVKSLKRNLNGTTVTLSEEQYSYVSVRVRELGLTNQIEVRLQDYRDIQGSFDKIISIEMLEAVGCEYYGLFFRQCEKLLAPHGTIGLQVITMPDCRFDNYRRQVDWLQTYIFPGGCLPSLHALNEAMKKNSGLHIEHLENIGFHYARTLQLWRERFLANLDKLPESKYDEKFRRTWLFYLYTCESAFKNRMLNDLQLILTRQGNHSIALKPY